jgi:hypothetical protein
MVYISFYANSSAQCKRGCGIGYGSMGSDTGTVIRKCIIIDKSTKTETGYGGVSGSKTTQRGVSSKFVAVLQFHPRPNNNIIRAKTQDDKKTGEEVTI